MTRYLIQVVGHALPVWIADPTPVGNLYQTTSFRRRARRFSAEEAVALKLASPPLFSLGGDEPTMLLEEEEEE